MIDPLWLAMGAAVVAAAVIAGGLYFGFGLTWLGFAAAATVAMASKRSFIFLTLAQNTDGQVPPANFVRNQCSGYNGDPGKCLHGRCCFAEDKRPHSKVLPTACDTGATA